AATKHAANRPHQRSVCWVSDDVRRCSTGGQDQGTAGPPPAGTAVPVRIHVSMRRVSAAAAAAWVGWGATMIVANPGGAGGGVAVKSGAMPPPTVTANAANAASTAGIAVASGRAKAASSALASVAAAAETVSDGGMTSAA